MHRSPAYRSRVRQRGATLVEALAALFIAALMFIGLSMLINTSMQNIRDQQAAQYQSQLATAAGQLVQANYATLASEATPTNPVVVPLHASGTALQLASFLPVSIQWRNAYSQSPCLLITAPASGGIDALLVTEGGQTIPDLELGYIAANAGQGGGSIPSKTASGAANNGAAYGAYGAWIVGSPNGTGASCSGTATGAGHLVSEVFTSAPANENADFLYRVRVPGYTDANAMHAPLYLHDTVTHVENTSDNDCSLGLANSIGKITADANGRVLQCESSGSWQFAGSSYWRDPVATQADLNALSTPQQGDVALVLQTGVPYEYVGGVWHSLVVDNNGNLIIGNALMAASRLDLTQTNTINSGCPDDSQFITGAGQISMDASGNVLSCQNGTWQNQSQINPGGSDVGCVIIMGSPGATDYSCPYSYSGTYPSASGNPGYDAGTGSYSYTETRTVQLSKPGIIAAAVWAHMYDEQCVNGNINFNNQGQVAVYVSIYNNDTGALIGRNEAQSPTITDDAAGINANLLQSASPNNSGYNVVVETDWANYNGLKTPYTTDYCGPSGNVVPTSPVVAGWTINSFY
ncbi:shufflon system plasmid conjugative transfer pilus tip adhesin PilV [Trinickia acidisoli]|uniref:shufflon system plasmid conjugative transfer pilus tip adhesin PilV n=1 Tax=Trinickia acidisoli TaxID=2767482 RepID=UPI001A8FE4E4|nr:shufflon system plasmid conjugative transfer pilus tip adhesin PilV [Trinickia acidisoli]